MLYLCWANFILQCLCAMVIDYKYARIIIECVKNTFDLMQKIILCSLISFFVSHRRRWKWAKKVWEIFLFCIFYNLFSFIRQFGAFVWEIINWTGVECYHKSNAKLNKGIASIVFLVFFIKNFMIAFGFESTILTHKGNCTPKHRIRSAIANKRPNEYSLNKWKSSVNNEMEVKSEE